VTSRGCLKPSPAASGRSSGARSGGAWRESRRPRARPDRLHSWWRSGCPSRPDGRSRPGNVLCEALPDKWHYVDLSNAQSISARSGELLPDLSGQRRRPRCSCAIRRRCANWSARWRPEGRSRNAREAAGPRASSCASSTAGKRRSWRISCWRWRSGPSPLHERASSSHRRDVRGVTGCCPLPPLCARIFGLRPGACSASRIPDGDEGAEK
jgi:hypothetical protein